MLLCPVTSSIIMMPRLYTSDLTDIFPLCRYSGAVYPLHENILNIEDWNLSLKKFFFLYFGSLLTVKKYGLYFWFVNFPPFSTNRSQLFLLPYHNLLVCSLVSNPYEQYAFPYEDTAALRIFPLLWNNECPIEALLIHLRNKKAEQREVIQHLTIILLKGGWNLWYLH
jgi:hypothetical protein